MDLRSLFQPLVEAHNPAGEASSCVSSEGDQVHAGPSFVRSEKITDLPESIEDLRGIFRAQEALLSKYAYSSLNPEVGELASAQIIQLRHGQTILDGLEAESMDCHYHIEMLEHDLKNLINTSTTGKISNSSPSKNPTHHAGLKAGHVDPKTENADLRAKHEALTAQYADLRAQHADLRAQHEAFTNQHADLRSEHADLRVEHADLRAKFEAVVTQQQDHKRMKGQHADLRAEHADLRAEYDSLKQEGKALRAERADLRAKHEGLEKHCESMEKELEKLRASNTRTSDRAHKHRELHEDDRNKAGMLEEPSEPSGDKAESSALKMHWRGRTVHIV
jgi:chromosome segregation ATPase